MARRCPSLWLVGCACSNAVRNAVHQYLMVVFCVRNSQASPVEMCEVCDNKRNFVIKQTKTTQQQPQQQPNHRNQQRELQHSNARPGSTVVFFTGSLVVCTSMAISSLEVFSTTTDHSMKPRLNITS